MLWLMLLCLFIAELLVYTWARVQCTRTGYEISALTKEQQRLNELQTNLKVELARLKAPAADHEDRAGEARADPAHPAPGDGDAVTPTRAKSIRFRILLVGLAFACGFGVIGGKALLLQIYQGSWLSQKASDQVEDSLRAVGKRGTIVDRRGREMAVGIDATSIAVRPAHLKNSETAAREPRRDLQGAGSRGEEEALRREALRVAQAPGDPEGSRGRAPAAPARGGVRGGVQALLPEPRARRARAGVHRHGRQGHGGHRVLPRRPPARHRHERPHPQGRLRQRLPVRSPARRGRRRQEPGAHPRPGRAARGRNRARRGGRVGARPLGHGARSWSPRRAPSSRWRSPRRSTPTPARTRKKRSGATGRSPTPSSPDRR
ncbi:MAG: hypothetical protein MZV70_49890 [Desulfobacterales bacterium]|nr:hypothetical protein [Desulfobacterales bacterium]